MKGLFAIIRRCCVLTMILYDPKDARSPCAAFAFAFTLALLNGEYNLSLKLEKILRESRQYPPW